MIRSLLRFTLFFLLTPLALPGRAASSFANPLDVLIADPQVLLDNGTYYLYGTGGNGFRAWTSPDLVNWRNMGLALTRTSSMWGKDRYWAPEVIKYQGSYYMFYSAGGADGTMRICVAKASSPLGPFTNLAAPLWDDDKAYIDAHVFVDTNGTPYLYCSQDMSVPADGVSEIWMARLTSNLKGLDSALTKCFGPSQSWESPGNKWNEAPFVIKNGSYYFLLYSGNVYSSPNYSIGYATATSPFGPWTKYSGNPIVKKTANVSGPGHCAVVKSPDGTQNWLVYHTQQQLTGGGDRQLAIDPLSFVAQPSGPARLVVAGPSFAMQSAPSGTPNFTVTTADEFTGSVLNRNRWQIFNEAGSNLAHSGGFLTITTAAGDTNGTGQADQQNILLCYPPSPDFEFEAKVNFSPAQNYEQASLFVWQDHNNFIRFSNAWIDARRWEIGVEVAGSFLSQQAANSLGADCWFRVRKEGAVYKFYGSTNGTAWSQVGSAKTVSLMDIRIGLGACSIVSERSLPAKFDYFRVTALNSDVNDWELY